MAGSSVRLTPAEELPDTPGRVRRQVQQREASLRAGEPEQQEEASLWTQSPWETLPAAPTYWSFSHSRDRWVETEVSALTAKGAEVSLKALSPEDKEAFRRRDEAEWDACFRPAP